MPGPKENPDEGGAIGFWLKSVTLSLEIPWSSPSLLPEKTLKATLGWELLKTGFDEEPANAAAKVVEQMELKDAPVNDSNPTHVPEVETLEVLMVEVAGASVNPVMGNSDDLLPELNSSEAGDEHPK